MTKDKIEEKMYFHAYQIDAAYINALVDLVNACRANKVDINEVKTFQGGFHVTFKGHEHADAICHDHSYGSPYYGCMGEGKTNDWAQYGDTFWETIGFPWDGDDVTIHSGAQLAQFIARINSGEEYNKDWE